MAGSKYQLWLCLPPPRTTIKNVTDKLPRAKSRYAGFQPCSNIPGSNSWLYSLITTHWHWSVIIIFSNGISNTICGLTILSAAHERPQGSMHLPVGWILLPWKDLGEAVLSATQAGSPVTQPSVKQESRSSSFPIEGKWITFMLQ